MPNRVHTGVGQGGKIARVPNAPKTPVRGFRIPDDLYAELQRLAARHGLTASDVVRMLVQGWVKRETRREQESESD